jgi:hypothetical protein
LLYLGSLTHPDTSEINVQNLAPVTGRDIGRWHYWPTNTGIVDSDVDAPEGAYGLTYGVFHRFLAADVHFDRLDVDIGVSVLQLVHRRLQSLWIYIRDCQALDAMGGKGVCSVLANTYGSVSTTAAGFPDRAPKIWDDLLCPNLPDAAPVTNAVPFSRDAILSVSLNAT